MNTNVCACSLSIVECEEKGCREGGDDDFVMTYETPQTDDPLPRSRRYRDERDEWIRLFNRLEAAVSHHKRATAEFATDADESLYAARERILKGAAKMDTA